MDQLRAGRRTTAAAKASVAFAAAAAAALLGLRPQTSFFAPLRSNAPAASSSLLRAGSRNPDVLMRAVQALVNERSDVFIRCVEDYDPEADNEDFDEGPPATGFRSLNEAIRPYHQNPEWMIWPSPGYARDQKICSMYTLATGLFQDVNRALREDNEDALRRLAPYIWELRQVLRFKVDTICKPEGRKCKPFTGTVLRGLDLPKDEVEDVANLYKEGTEFSWPSFTACQLDAEGDGSGLWPFDGNLNFVIKCDVDAAKLGTKEVYAPVRISRFLGDTSEVLFPPHTKFKVVESRPKEEIVENEGSYDERRRVVYTRVLEVVDLPTPWAEEQKRK
mmetsp:Transcript_111046/g.278027  ORF Transcript_111046/g.278027 Transcript_111046/m.278027 type:complete len:334 (+) Transcript_111046:159-1160(+)